MAAGWFGWGTRTSHKLILLVRVEWLPQLQEGEAEVTCSRGSASMGPMDCVLMAAGEKFRPSHSACLTSKCDHAYMCLCIHACAGTWLNDNQEQLQSLSLLILLRTNPSMGRNEPAATDRGT